MADEKQQLKVTQMVWGMTGISVIAYAVIATVIKKGFEIKPADPTMLKVLIVLSTVMFLASCLIPPRIFSSNRDPLKEITLMELTTAFKMQIAMNDAIAIFGLVLAFQTNDASLCYPFVAVALIHHVFRFPSSKERLISFYQKK